MGILKESSAGQLGRQLGADSSVQQIGERSRGYGGPDQYDVAFDGDFGADQLEALSIVRTCAVGRRLFSRVSHATPLFCILGYSGVVVFRGKESAITDKCLGHSY